MKIEWKTKNGFILSGNIAKWKFDALKLIDSVSDYRIKGTSYPLKWDAKADYNLDFDKVLPLATDIRRIDARYHGESLNRAIATVRAKYNAGEVWDAVIQTMRERLNDGDDVVRETHLKKWGVKSFHRVQPHFVFEGRNGARVCLVEFEDVDLTDMCIHYDLAATIFHAWEKGDDSFTDEWLRKLCAYIEQCNETFSFEGVKREFYDIAANFLAYSILDNMR